MQAHIDTAQALKSTASRRCSKESNQKPKLIIMSIDFAKEGEKKLSCLRLLEKKKFQVVVGGGAVNKAFEGPLLEVESKCGIMALFFYQPTVAGIRGFSIWGHSLEVTDSAIPLQSRKSEGTPSVERAVRPCGFPCNTLEIPTERSHFGMASMFWFTSHDISHYGPNTIFIYFTLNPPVRKEPGTKQTKN